MALLTSCFRLSRPKNAGLAAAAVLLGFWLSRSPLGPLRLVCLCMAAAAATAFGNVVNDIRDVDTDRISHPDRPLPRNELSKRTAGGFAILLAVGAAALSFAASPGHLLATVIPLALLALYALFLKATPLAGNVIVSLLVAYALLYGGIHAPGLGQLMAPAGLAFLVNLLREIVKDQQDEPGDRAAGMATTAILPERAIRVLVFCLSGLFVLLLPVPFLLGHFGMFYGVISLVGILPLHIFWIVLFASENSRQRLTVLSALLKVELAIGLAAMAGDRLLR